MTIKVEQITTTDLYAAVDTLKFDPAEVAKYVPSVPKLSAVTFLATKVDPVDSLADLAQACGEEIMPFLSKHRLNEYRIWLFVAHDSWLPDTRVSRYKKLWKGNHNLKEFLDVMNKSDEVAISSDVGLRYAGLIELPEDKLSQAVELSRKNSACCIILSNRPDICSSESVRDIFSSAFPKDNKGREVRSIDWFSLVARLCSKGDLVIRVYGPFDDTEASVDIMFAREGPGQLILENML